MINQQFNDPSDAVMENSGKQLRLEGVEYNIMQVSSRY